MRKKLDIEEEKKRVMAMYEIEHLCRKKGYKYIAGVDEAGRGPLAGPVADYTCPPAFSYSNIPAYLVGLAAGNAAGEPLSDYLRRELLAPLGIESPVFRTDPQGRFYGATGMELSVEELSRLGRLYMQDGLWNGKRLFSGSWAEAAVRPQIDAGKGQGYGYFFWTGLRDFSVSGKWGQKCLVYPGRKLIISWEGEMPETSGKFERAVRQLVSDGGDR